MLLEPSSGPGSVIALVMAASPAWNTVCPKCPLQYRLEQGLASGSLDCWCRPLAAFLMLDKQALYEQK